MRLLSPILHRVFYPALGSVGYFHARELAPVTVATYHGVLPAGYKSEDAFLDNTLVSEEVFREHLRLLKKHYNVISPDEFLNWIRGGSVLPPKSVLLTCDDGLLNHLTVMVPILQQEELECLFFVTGASAGETSGMLWYVELYLLLQHAKAQDQPVHVQGVTVPGFSNDRGRRRSVWLALMKLLSRLDVESRRGFLDECAARFGLERAWKARYFDDPVQRGRFQLLRSSELRQLRDAGMSIGAHTLSHPMLGEQELDMARAELAGCRATLEHVLGEPAWAIAYPFGDPASMGSREYKLAQDAGYDCAFVNVSGILDKDRARFALPRVHITAEMSLPVYEAYISGFHSALQSRFRPAPSGA